MRLWIAGIVGLLVIGGSALAQGVAPIGGPFQVNAYTTKQQQQPQVAKDDQGDFVVVWRSIGGYGTDLAGWSIQARRFEANGQPKDVDFQVNSYTTSSQENPTVATDDLGNFVVAWEHNTEIDIDIFVMIVRTFDVNGVAYGNAIRASVE